MIQVNSITAWQWVIHVKVSNSAWLWLISCETFMLEDYYLQADWTGWDIYTHLYIYMIDFGILGKHIVTLWQRLHSLAIDGVQMLRTRKAHDNDVRPLGHASREHKHRQKLHQLHESYEIFTKVLKIQKTRGLHLCFRANTHKHATRQQTLSHSKCL